MSSIDQLEQQRQVLLQDPQVQEYLKVTSLLDTAKMKYNAEQKDKLMVEHAKKAREKEKHNSAFELAMQHRDLAHVQGVRTLMNKIFGSPDDPDYVDPFTDITDKTY